MNNLPKKLTLLLIILGVSSFIGWFYNINFLTKVSSRFLSIAPLTSILMTLIGSFYLLSFNLAKSKYLFKICISIAVLSLFITIFNTIDYFFITNWSFENEFFKFINKFKPIESIYISPIVPVLFTFSILSFLLFKFKNNKLGLTLNKIIFYIESIVITFFFVGYIENISFIYLDSIYSLAFITVVAFIIIIYMQLYQFQFKIWPFQKILDNSTKSKLIRSFLPVIIGIFLIGNLIESHFLKTDSGISSSILLIFLVSAIAFLYFIISNRISKEFEESKSLYQSMFDSSIVGLYQTTPKGKILNANPSLIKMLEFDSLEDLMQRDLTKPGGYIDLNRRKKFEDLLEQNDEISNFESQWYTKTGKIITVEEGAKAIRNEFGNIIRYEGVVQNISDYKRALDAIKESEDKLNMVLNLNEVGIWTLNLLDHSAYRTIQHDKIFGYQTLLPKWTYEMFLNHVHIEDKNLVDKKFNYSLENNLPWDFECRIHRIDGALRWIRASGHHQINSNSKSVSMSGIVQDITESKLRELEITEAKNELEDIFKNDISANFTASVRGEIIDCNRTFLKLFNFDSLEVVKTIKITDLYLNPIKRKHLLKLILQNKKILNEEVDFITTNGKIINCLVNLVGVFNSNNKLIKTRGYLVDITKMKQYENDLKQSEERFKLATKATNEVIWERDLIKKTFWRSENFATVFGWNNDDFGYTDEDIKKRMHPEDLERVSNKIYAFFESNQNIIWEDTYRMLTGNGTYAWVYDRAFKLNDKNGNAIKVVGSMTNITENKLQEQLLKETEENYKNILENALIGVYQTDLTGQILFTNQYIKDQSGYILGGEIEKLNILDLYVHPSKRKEMLDTLQKNGVVTNLEVAFYTKTKQIKICLMNAKLFGNKIVGMLLDITQIKTNELELSKLSKAIHQSPVSVIITNLKGEIEYGNPKTTETTGYSLYELIGKTPRIFSSGEKSAEEYQELWNALLSGKEWFGEFHNKKKNGELFWEKASISPVFNSNNKITNFIAIKEDITKQKEVLNELMVAKDKAEESDRLKSAFLANMSHEIRTPMNGILGFSELLKTPNLTPDKQQKYIEIIEKSGKRMLTTINDIIDISKIESKLVKMYTKEVNILKQIQEIYSFFQPEAIKKGLQLIDSSDMNLAELKIQSDPDKIYAIIQNLVKNAIKFTKVGSVSVGCFIDQNTLNIFVSDTGIGIPENRQPYIFDRFVQADIEDKEVYEGSGLGLTISKSYAQMLGGDIVLESTEGVGSTFIFSLPINTTLVNTDNQLNDFNKLESVNTNHTKNLNILIVDDESLVQLYLEEILFKKANQLFVASNGEEALKIFKMNPAINLILLDIQMPIMNGYEVAQQIRTFNKDVVIIAQTAYVQTGDKEKTLKAGCNAYISKPINHDELFTLINNYFNN